MEILIKMQHLLSLFMTRETVAKIIKKGSIEKGCPTKDPCMRINGTSIRSGSSGMPGDNLVSTW